jgi:ParB family chromosome partitioning protein
MPELRNIAIGLIDEPPAPIRLTMDGAKLRELSDSIRDIGLQQPITVIEETAECRCPGASQNLHWDNCLAPDTKRYRIVTGHRRFIAHQMLGATDVLCIVRRPGELQEIAAMIAENACREDLNPAEEAIWFHTLVSEQGYTEENLMTLTRRTADYIGDRFRLLRGDEMVFAAVQANDIPYAVARELNKMEDQPMRRYYLDAAIRGGVSSRVVRRWVEEWRNNQVPQTANPVQMQPAEVPAAVEAYRHCCELCGGDRDPWNFVNVTLHKWEWDQLQKAMKEAGNAV